MVEVQDLLSSHRFYPKKKILTVCFGNFPKILRHFVDKEMNSVQIIVVPQATGF